MARLTKLEREMVVRAMLFVDAGEWPWTPCNDGTPEKRMVKEKAAFESALRKLEN